MYVCNRLLTICHILTTEQYDTNSIFTLIVSFFKHSTCKSNRLGRNYVYGNLITLNAQCSLHCCDCHSILTNQLLRRRHASLYLYMACGAGRICGCPVFRSCWPMVDSSYASRSHIFISVVCVVCKRYSDF